MVMSTTTVAAQPSTEAQRLLDDVTDAASEGTLRLDTIDMYWEQALALTGEQENGDIAEQIMAVLSPALDEQLAKLSGPIERHGDLFAAAIVDRDFDSRAAAYEALNEIISRGGGFEPDPTSAYGLHSRLQDDVAAELVRREALASGNVGPALDPDDLPPLPDRLLLVQWSDGFYWPNLVVLVGLDGEPIGYLDGYTLSDDGRMSIAGGEIVENLPYEQVPQLAEGEECLISYETIDRVYLICNDTTSYDDPAWAAEVRVEYADGTTERIGGAGYVYPELDPAQPVAGYWVRVYPSPDGSAVLGQWSGECETPSAHMIYDGAVSDGVGVAGDVWPESWALGWRDDGLALVVLTGGPCSSDPIDDSGVYTWSPQGDLEPLYLTSTGGVIATLIAPNDPLAE